MHPNIHSSYFENTCKICYKNTYIFDTSGLHEWKPRLKERKWGLIFSTGYATKGPRASMQGKRAAT